MNTVTSLGLLGGTFDPIHAGHLAMARAARERLGLEKVLFLPAGTPWQRQPSAGAAERLEMVKLALAGHPEWVVDDREVRRAAPTYTIDTLRELRDEWGSQRPLWLILGTDAFLNLPTWKNWDSIFGLAHVAILCRNGSPLRESAMSTALRDEWQRRQCPVADGQTRPCGTLVGLEMPPVPVSSTLIRENLATLRGVPVDTLAPAVLEYINQHHLYCETPR